ncbi:MAG: prephenate dehydrogenase dimerization domain-containing protein, partial [Myxococcota bacterium]
SLREMTRVAGSDPALWREILLANRAVPEMLGSFRAHLDELDLALRSRDAALLGRLLCAARRARKAIA